MSEETGSEQTRTQGAADTQVDEDARRLEKLGYKQELKRSLGLFASFALQFSLISVGGGVFLVFSVGLNAIGPAFFWGWILGGALQMSVALSIAELASAFPLAASSFSWVRRLYSNSLAWMVGYVLIVGHIAAAASINFGIAPYLLGFFGVSGPPTWQIVLVALVLVAIETIIAIVSVRFSAIVNNIGVTAELVGMSTVIIILLILGLRRGPGVIMDTAGTVTGGGGEFFLAFVLAFLVPAYTIASFDATCNVGEEMHNAPRNVPRGAMIAALSAYVYGILIIAIPLMAVTSIGATIQAPLPLEYILQDRLGFVGATFFEVIIITGLFVAAMMLQVTGARMIWGQARDGALPAANWLHRLNTGKVPANATILAGVIAGAFVLWSNALAVIAALVALAWAAAYGVTVAVSLYGKLKGRVPADRGWNLGKWGIANDILAVTWSVALCVALAYSDVTRVLGGFIVVVAVGLVIYYGYVKRHWSPPPIPDMRVDESQDVPEEETSA